MQAGIRNNQSSLPGLKFVSKESFNIDCYTHNIIIEI